MRWAAAIATEGHLDDAVASACDEVDHGLAGARPDLVLAFVTDHHAARFPMLAPAIAKRYPDALLCGCSVGGAIGGGVEIEHEPALSITAARLPGVRVTPVHAGTDPRKWRDQIDVDEPEHSDATFLLLPCPLSAPAEELIDHLDDRWPEATKIGGLASGGMMAHGPRGNTLFLGEERFGGGTVGVALAGDLHVDTIVAQGCRPIGEPLIVTRGAGHVALELDGRPALATLERLIARLTPDERELARHSLFVGVAMTSGGPLGPGDFLIRNLVGIDPQRGAVAAATTLEPGQVLQFHLRDASAAADDLDHLLAAHDGAPPAGALLFSCMGRGRLLFGAPDHDSRVFRNAIGEIPLGGFFGNGEIGPVHGRTFLHGYTSAFALFGPRESRA
jgi:small ligand-binding sensory domain FIST